MDHDTTDPHPEWDEDERERYFQRVIEKAAAKGQAEVATKRIERYGRNIVRCKPNNNNK